jgi:AraC family transcriptional regulator of adaptative response/methylated-DNA-[protein]-cysteine methyltransferase
MLQDFPITTMASRYPEDDYDRIARAIEFLRAHAAEQPGLAVVAAAVHLSEFHLQRLFTRWAGLSPKRFLQCLTVEHAKARLRAAADVLSATLDVGLSSPGRLHDLFVTLEAVTPGEFKAGGAGVRIAYGFQGSPFGECLVATTARGICALEFVAGRARRTVVAELAQRWPAATLTEAPGESARIAERIFHPRRKSALPLTVLVQGTNFQVQVWRALLRVPPGAVVSYRAVAQGIGRPTAVRAVGSAVGANPVAFLIPCHRVLRADGEPGGYRWGLTRKAACQLWEEARWPAAVAV